MLPRWYFWFVRLIGDLVPGPSRREWISRWFRELTGWWVLSERGEVPGRSIPTLPMMIRDAATDAVQHSLSIQAIGYWARGAVFPLVAAAAGIGVLAILTNGYATTRGLFHLLATPRPFARYDWAGDRLVANLAPIAFAYAIGVLLVWRERHGLLGSSARFRLYLAAKALLIATGIPLFWIETGAAVRASIPHEGLRVLGGGLLFAFLFIGTFAWAVLWSLNDQRQRCPVCLRRLTLPVSLGSWASTFDAPAIESLCEDGHGSLYAPETSDGEPDHWVRFDKSWHGLFVR